MQPDTVFALSSGNPPAAIAVIRISGPRALDVLHRLTGFAASPRRATLVSVTDPGSGELLDRGLALSFPGPATATGENIAELHLHGGRAVVRAVLSALGRISGLREAEPGEFTRRAFENGRIDLTEAEGLADLLEAETELQRRWALNLAQGSLSRRIADWQDRLLALSAAVEAILDFSDESDVEQEFGQRGSIHPLVEEIETLLSRPGVERLRDGIRVAIAGPPNAGKSSLLNVLAGRDAAIVSAIPGTTRDVIEAPIAIAGIPFLLTDTAGLRDSKDEIESIGIGRAHDALEMADLVLWLGEGEAPSDTVRTITVGSKRDLRTGRLHERVDVEVSAITGEGIADLVDLLVQRGRNLLPKEGEIAVNARHREALADALDSLRPARLQPDLILLAEHFREARLALNKITGQAGVEEMLDALFGRFCIGK